MLSFHLGDRFFDDSLGFFRTGLGRVTTCLADNLCESDSPMRVKQWLQREADPSRAPLCGWLVAKLYPRSRLECVPG